MRDELTEEQIDALHEKLLELRDELTETIAAARESSKAVELDQSAFGRVSRIDAIQQQQMSAAHRQRAKLRLTQVKGALSAIERDDYGYCNMCDEPIGFKRLSVRPEAPICLECQSERER